MNMPQQSATIEKERAVATYAPLVKRIAYHMMARLPASVQVDDLIQVGLIGLMDAVANSDGARGAQFIAYASQRIRGAMLDELRHADWLPRTVRKNARQIEAAISKLEQRLGCQPSEQQIANELGIELPQYQEMLQTARGSQIMYYEDFHGAEDNDFFDQHTSEKQSNPMELLADERFRAVLVEALKALPERERTVMALYYEQDLNLKEIGAVMGVTESRISQLHSQAVARLRVKFKD